MIDDGQPADVRVRRAAVAVAIAVPRPDPFPCRHVVDGVVGVLDSSTTAGVIRPSRAVAGTCARCGAEVVHYADAWV